MRHFFWIIYFGLISKGEKAKVKLKQEAVLPEQEWSGLGRTMREGHTE